MTTIPHSQSQDIERSIAYPQERLSRAHRRYVDLVAGEGMAHRRFAPDELRDNDAGFHVFDRIASC